MGIAGGFRKLMGVPLAQLPLKSLDLNGKAVALELSGCLYRSIHFLTQMDSFDPTNLTLVGKYIGYDRKARKTFFKDVSPRNIDYKRNNRPSTTTSTTTTGTKNNNNDSEVNNSAQISRNGSASASTLESSRSFQNHQHQQYQQHQQHQQHQRYQQHQEYQHQQPHDFIACTSVYDREDDDLESVALKEMQNKALNALILLGEEGLEMATSLFDVYGVKELHVVLEGTHPAKTSTIKKRKVTKQKSGFPPSIVYSMVVDELLDRFGEDRIKVYPSPHDADGQLAYLCAIGAVDYGIVPSNDSDMLLFHGMKDRLVLNPFWGESNMEGVVYEGSSLSLPGFTVRMLRCYATLVGCDYYSVPSVGPVRAANLIRKHWDDTLSAEENCNTIEKNINGKDTACEDWQVSSLADAYRCFSGQRIITVDGNVSTLDRELHDLHLFSISSDDASVANIDFLEPTSTFTPTRQQHVC
eukprot:m.241164 g.241164  ORF g.241164 m.241164 type:complete len:469 (+) comp18358_c0_seq1:195-1601(+)